MSYEQALAQLQAGEITAPDFTALPTSARLRRRADAWQWTSALCSLAGALAFGGITGEVLLRASGGSVSWWAETVSRGPGFAALLPCTLLLLAAVLVLRRRVIAQTVVRAVWWSNVVVGTLMSHLLNQPLHRAFGTVGALACGFAILVADRRGLDGSAEDAAEGHFRPAAFRGLLTLALVMAFADAQTLAFSAIARMGFGELGWSLLAAVDRAGFTILSALTMAVAVWGLTRLRTWALLLNLVANLVIAGLALHGVLGLSMAVASTLAVTAFVQAFLPVPILALAMGGPRAERSVFLHHGHRIATGLVVLFMAVAAGGLLRGDMRYSGWYEGSGSAFIRGLGDIVPHPSEDFSDADLRGQRLQLRLEGADFTDADARASNFVSSHLPDSVWTRTRLEEASFGHARLTRARFSDVELSSVKFDRCDLTDARFERVRFENADLTATITDGARFEDVEWVSTVCPDRTRSEDHGGTCEGAGIRRPETDRRLVGRYRATPEAEQTLAANEDKSELMSSMQSISDHPPHDPRTLEVDSNLTYRRFFEFTQIRMGLVGLIHRTDDVFVPADFPPIELRFDDDATRVRVRFPDGAEIEYVRE